MFRFMINILILIAIQQSHGQDLGQLEGGIPDDVELLAGRDGASDKLAMPFNRGYSNYPVVLLQPTQGQQGPAFQASAVLFGDNAEGGPMGQIIFTQYSLDSPVIVTMNATGLPAGKHAIHIHAFGDLREGCKSTGPHMRNILVGNVEVKEDGKLEINFRSPYLALFGPSKGIIGRSIVIHEKPIEYNRFPDIRGYPITPTLNDQPAQVEEMAVGGTIACGIITITNILQQ